MVQRKLVCATVIVLFALSALATDRTGSEKITPSANTTPAVQSAPTEKTGDNVSPTQPTSVAVPTAGEQIKWQVISGGGNRGTSASYILSGTVGQTAVGLGTSASYKINQGFWQNFVAPCDDCGDANSDATIDISDAVFLIAYIFGGGPPPGPCVTPTGMGDANGDGIVDISDAVYLIAYIFGGGPAPHCP